MTAFGLIAAIILGLCVFGFLRSRQSREPKLDVQTFPPSELVLSGMREGRRYEAVVFEVRERKRGEGFEPIVAILALKQTAAAEVRSTSKESI